MGLREWWDKLTGKKDQDSGERGYRAGSSGAGSVSGSTSELKTNQDAVTGSTDDDDTKGDGRSS